MMKPFFDSYSGQTVSQLLAMESEYRVDSLVCALESALWKKNTEGRAWSEAERTVIVVEAMEREVNNGGFHQFFINSSGEYAGETAARLREIGCYKTAQIVDDAVNALGIRGTVDYDACIAAANSDNEALIETLNECDGRYYNNDEPIADLLFQWVGQNQVSITIP